MPRFIAFLRAINLGGARSVTMDSLRQIFESLDFSDVETFIASGNVVFKTMAKDRTRPTQEIEQALRSALGYEVDVFIRTDAELIKIAKNNPFPEADFDALTSCNVIFLTNPLRAKFAQKLKATATDEFRVRGREIYWLRRRGKGNPFSTVPFEKVLGRTFTIRACNTIKRMVAKYLSAAPPD